MSTVESCTHKEDAPVKGGEGVGRRWECEGRKGCGEERVWGGGGSVRGEKGVGRRWECEGRCGKEVGV